MKVDILGESEVKEDKRERERSACNQKSEAIHGAAVRDFALLSEMSGTGFVRRRGQSAVYYNCKIADGKVDQER